MGLFFYGASIQGARDAEERVSRARVNRALISAIKSHGHDVFSEHTAGRNKGETLAMLEEEIGPLPSIDSERRFYVRRRMVEAVEIADLKAAIFEVSVPSHGTGVEFAHAYLRPRVGLPEIPILVLYKKDYSVHGLSTMVRGLCPEEFPNVQVLEYADLQGAKRAIGEFSNEFN